MTTIEDLSSSFENRLECLRTLVDLKYASEEMDCNRHFENLLNEVEKLENVLIMMRSLVEKQKEESKQIQVIMLSIFFWGKSCISLYLTTANKCVCIIWYGIVWLSAL